MKSKTRFLLLALVALGLPATADECKPTTTEPWIDAEIVYVDGPFCEGPHCLFSFWVYQESNGIDGLQRGDEVKDDTCDGEIESDTIIF